MCEFTNIIAAAAAAAEVINMAALRPNLQANPRSPRSGTSLHQMEEAYMDMEEWPGSMDNYMPEL